MDYRNIIVEGELIYSSRATDTLFREWQLARTLCNITYCTTIPLSKLDRVILLVLAENGRLYENQLAKILGFNIEDDFDSNPKRYADEGEKGVFQGILSEVEAYGLLHRKDHSISLSNIGSLALKKGVKYSFYSATVALMENFDLQQKDSVAYKMFPYRKELGIVTHPQNIVGLDYISFDIPELENAIYNNHSELVTRLSLQCNNDIHIFKAEMSSESRLGEVYLDFRLYEYNSIKYPLVFHQNKVSQYTNDLLLDDCNTAYIKRKVHIGEYYFLVNNSNDVLNYQSLSPYMDIWSLDDFLTNSRFDWSDEMLFSKIAEKANGSHWAVISNACPTNDLISRLANYKDSFDWVVLSSRFDDEFIVQNATLYPWDFEALSSNRSAGFIQQVIIIPELHKETDWDWEMILSKLDEEFVINNISRIPFNMHSVSERYLYAYPDVIVEHPDKNWNWQYISSEIDPLYLLQRISELSNYIQFEVVMPRVFASSKYAEVFCDCEEFTSSVILKKEWLQYRYNANSADYLWTAKLIEWHERLGFISWKSENKTEGFECNKGISWNYEIFNQFKDRTFSIKGLIHISKSIENNVSIDQNPNFKWMWDILSSRDIVTQNLAFIERHIADISFKVAIPLIDSLNLSILYGRSDFRQKVTEQNAWDKLTNCIEKSTILRNISDPNWDWHIITKNFCHSLNFTALEKYNVLEKLDWEYISKNVNTTKIVVCLDKYIEHWDWAALTQRLDSEFIIDNLPKYYDYWDWEYIITHILSDSDLSKPELRIELAIIFSQFEEEVRKILWSKFTARYKTKDILVFIRTNSQLSDTSVNFEWNYSDLYNRRDFDINDFLAEYKELGFYIDWDALSKSKALNKILLWDRKEIKDFSVWENVVLGIISNKKYSWNFKYLSAITSINWCDKILQSRESEWDWEYLSEYSKCFTYNPRRPNEVIKNIRRFAQHLDFVILSKRVDLDLSSEMMRILIDYNWDWHAISSNKGFKISADFVQENKTFLWDWYVLSSRKDCNFTAEFIAENSHYPWDWEALSKRKDIPFTADIIIRLVDKEWNWKHLTNRSELYFTEDMLHKFVDKDINWINFSRRHDFCPTMTTLELLKDKELDWDDISKRIVLPYEVIVNYKDRLNWSILTKSNSIDLSKRDMLQTFRDNLDWKHVSISPNFKPSVDILLEFKEFVDWGKICDRGDIVFDIPFLDAFKDKVDWKRISQSVTISFSEEIIDRYQGKWDWVALSENPAFRSSGIGDAYAKELNLNEFYVNLKKQRHGRPSVYHFTHMFNAIEIIKSRKILSRNRVRELGLLKYDAAGSVVHRSEKAHPYARFYFRTGTQTQFYNECLGKQHGTKYFSRAENNGLPMCPMPVFFKFDLQEVLAKHADLCYYSTGNMQTGWARVYKVTEEPNNIDYVNLYSEGWTKEVQEKKQQEFLVKNEFDFSELKDFQIICYDREETDILRSMFKNDPICKHIYSVYEIGDRIYENENPSLKFSITNETLEIDTAYCGNYIFQIESPQINKIKINNSPRYIKAIKGQIIQLLDHVSVKLGSAPFDIYYVNMNPYARSPRWLVYQYNPEDHDEKITEDSIIEGFLGISMEDGLYSPTELITSLGLVMPKLEDLYNTKVRHYVIKRHTELVCEQFEKFPFNFNSEYMSIDMMRIILALHDIGKAVDRANQHEHTISLINELWPLTPFVEYELKLAESLLKNDSMGKYFMGKLSLEELKREILEDAKSLTIPPDVLLGYKMIIYQCDISSYTKDAGGLKYLEHMFEYQSNEKVFDNDEGIIKMSEEYANRYSHLKQELYG